MNKSDSKLYDVIHNGNIIGVASIDNSKIELIPKEDDKNNRKITFETLIKKSINKKVIPQGYWKIIYKAIKYSTIHNLELKKQNFEFDEVRYLV